MKKLISIIIVIVFVCGCSASPKRASSLQQDAILLAEEVIELKKKAEVREKLEKFIGFSILEDKRPSQEISYMTSINEKVAEEILRGLRDAGLFKEIHHPASDDDIIVITGNIHRFIWESAETMVSYIPVLNVFTIFGLPSQRVRGEVDISLEFRNKKTGKIIRSFREKSLTQRKYNIYSFKREKEDKELTESFARVTKKLVERIRKDKNSILDAVGEIPVALDREQQLPVEEEIMEEVSQDIEAIGESD